ncbi:MAG TPA: alanyl-tRNA editing protein [Bryobacteraceae bacterium]|nr:alanyl-tRNA editing protein [Bryobacteraceae bacterium]
MTERLYYNDPYLMAFTAQPVEIDEGGRRIYLDRTAFYPSSGGQPNDLGTLAGVPVLDVVDEEDRVAHVVASPVAPGTVTGMVDWPRRLDHMQQHTGQHLLSAVLEELYEISTFSFHIGAQVTTIDVDAAAVTPEQIAGAGQRANEIVWENRPVTVTYEEASQARGLRKPSDREGILRIVSIEDIDRSACGGTHVRSTAGIGPIVIRKLDRVRGSVRIEFLCGGRALTQARTDYETLTEVARACSCAPDQTPQVVTALLARAQELEKTKRKLALELASFKGKQLYDTGQRRIVERRPSGTIDDELRAFAQSFTAGSGALYLAIFDDPPSMMLSTSKDRGLHAGDLLKKALSAAGGRGGGNAQLAQGSVPTPAALEQLLTLLQQAIG